MQKSADEYLIYVFSNYKANLFGVNKWRFIGKNSDAQKSLAQARKLYESQKFDRIEIKRKSFDSRQNKYKLSTFEVLTKSKRKIFPKIFA